MSRARFDFIRYANCWEDTDNLLTALPIRGGRGLSILSAGDNTLAMLINDPQHITAIDINPAQIHLYRLKEAGFKKLSYEELIALLGVYDTRRSYDIFLALEDVMEPQAFRYFSEHREFFKKGIVNIGKFENYFKLFRRYVIPLFSTRGRFRKLAAFSNIEEQAQYYSTVINNRRMKAVCNFFFGFKMMGSLGRDRAFYDYVEDKEDCGKNIKQIVDYGLTHIPNFDNPYITYICTGKYAPHCLPVYLRRENFDIIRDRIDRIEVVHGDLSAVGGQYDFFNLSDIFEYISDEEFALSIDQISALSRGGAVLAYYNMQNKRYFDDKRFEPLGALSQRLTLSTKSYFYRDFCVYSVRSGS